MFILSIMNKQGPNKPIKGQASSAVGIKISVLYNVPSNIEWNIFKVATMCYNGRIKLDPSPSE